MRCIYCGSEDVEYADTLPLDKEGFPYRRKVLHIQVSCQVCQAEYVIDRDEKIVSRYNASTGMVAIFIREDLTREEIQQICSEMRLINEGEEGGEE